MMPADAAAEIQEMMREKFLVDIKSSDDDLLSSGILDSLTLVQLLVMIEERFGVQIPLSDLEIDDIRTINSIVNLISNRKLVHATQA
jgi:D-alanine--poly(phosphoribitol) ligase subunit 2